MIVALWATCYYMPVPILVLLINCNETLLLSNDSKNVFIMPPASKKLTGHIGFGLLVRPSVRACIHSSRTVHARVLKFHIWIRLGKYLKHICFLVLVISLS